MGCAKLFFFFNGKAKRCRKSHCKSNEVKPQEKECSVLFPDSPLQLCPAPPEPEKPPGYLLLENGVDYCPYLAWDIQQCSGTCASIWLSASS